MRVIFDEELKAVADDLDRMVQDVRKAINGAGDALLKQDVEAAQPHHGHMRAGEAPGALLAEKTAHASESPRVSRHAHISSPFVRTIRFLKCE